MLALRLPRDIEKRLDALAKKTGRSKSFYAQEAILRHIKDIEDYHLATRRLRRGGRRTSLKTLERQARSARADWSLSTTFSEWSTPADAKAYDDL